MTGWTDSNRRQRLPANWNALRDTVTKRAGGRCEAIKSSGRRCPNPGTDCDHIVAGDDHDPANLQLLCLWHHRAKSAAEGHAAAKANRDKLTRPQQKHPGLR